MVGGKQLVARVVGERIVAPEILSRLRIDIIGPHFTRNGGRFCECCVLYEDISEYRRIRQLNLDGKTYLVRCRTAHGSTRFGDDGKPLFHSTETNVFTAKNLEDAEIFEVDRAKLDRSDLTKGQRLLSGEERAGVIRRILHEEGELLTLSEVCSGIREADGNSTFYLHDEEHPPTDWKTVISYVVI